MLLDSTDIAICLGQDEDLSARHGAMMPPVVQTSLFAFSTLDELVAGLSAEHENYVYSRGQNPTVEVLEKKLAALERGESCKCVASGMAAVSIVMVGLLETGDHILFVNQTYGPTLQLAEHLSRFGITHDVVLELSLDSISAAIRPETKLIWMESPGTMLNRVVDVPGVATLAKEKGILTAMDNTWATPLLQKPLTRGVDLVLHTCTKYIGGHSDVMGGAVIGTAELMEQIFYRSYLLLGASLGPSDAWLLIRGLRTLPARLRNHEENVLVVGEFLQDHPKVKKVFHPAFAPDTALVQSQLKGFTGLLSFELMNDEFETVKNVIDSLRLFHIGVSWGGVESLVITPAREGNAGALSARGIPRGLIRISVGLEDSATLVEDLGQALAHA